MAFTLEAAMTLPLAMVIWTGLISSAGPAYEKTRASAGLFVKAACFSLGNQHLYKTEIFNSGNMDMIGLQTSPQAVLEIWNLIQDDFSIVGSTFSDNVYNCRDDIETDPT